MLWGDQSSGGRHPLAGLGTRGIRLAQMSEWRQDFVSKWGTCRLVNPHRFSLDSCGCIPNSGPAHLQSGKRPGVPNQSSHACRFVNCFSFRSNCWTFIAEIENDGDVNT